MLCCSSTVKEAGKDFTYLIVVLIGLGVTGNITQFSESMDHA